MRVSQPLHLCMILFLVCLTNCGPSTTTYGESFFTILKEGPRFSVRATAYHEKRVFGQALAGAHYIYEAKMNGNADWQKFLEIRHDDPLLIDDNSVAFINENAAYVFKGSKYAVSVDSGKTWIIWQGNFTAAAERYGPFLIETVNVDADGKGVMDVIVLGSERPEKLITENFGLEWR